MIHFPINRASKYILQADDHYLKYLSTYLTQKSAETNKQTNKQK